MPQSTDYLVEILGCPATGMFEPVNADYLCPFIGNACVKRGHNTTDPFPVCSIQKYINRGKDRRAERPVVVCPKRFFQADLVTDILEHCWIGSYDRSKIVSVKEIKMGKAGTVDMVICDTSDLPNIEKFISVELQAIDITGTVSDVYSAHTNRVPLTALPKYNFNTSNVLKRYLTQLIKKGYFHSTWNKKIVAVVQDVLLESIRERVRFAPTDPKNERTDIIFISYTLDTSLVNEEGYYDLKLREVVGTQHSALMNAVVYEPPPNKGKFIEAIKRQLEP